MYRSLVPCCYVSFLQSLSDSLILELVSRREERGNVTADRRSHAFFNGTGRVWRIQGHESERERFVRASRRSFSDSPSSHTSSPDQRKDGKHASSETQAISRLFSRRLAHPQTPGSNLRSYSRRMRGNDLHFKLPVFPDAQLITDLCIHTQTEPKLHFKT